MHVVTLFCKHSSEFWRTREFLDSVNTVGQGLQTQSSLLRSPKSNCHECLHLVMQTRSTGNSSCQNIENVITVFFYYPNYLHLSEGLQHHSGFHCRLVLLKHDYYPAMRTGSSYTLVFSVVFFFGWSLAPDLRFSLGQRNTPRVFRYTAKGFYLE